MRSLRLFLLCAAVISNCAVCGAWDDIGHQSTVVIAERHLTEDAKICLKALFDYPLRDDASWMDAHRKDSAYAFTGNYHTMAMNHDFVYAPSFRIASGGDCVTGLQYIDAMLSRKDKLGLDAEDQRLLVRMLIHIVGDMHCPCHSYIMPERNHWRCSLNGVEYKYHGFIDHIPDLLFEGMVIDDIAAKLDTFDEKHIEAIQNGSYVDWAQDCCNRDKSIYDINPYGRYNLDPDTVEKLRPCAEDALRVGGYRLAMLLNKYFTNNSMQ